MQTRRATVDDLDQLLGDVQEGFDSYGQFAPRGWQPPDVAADREWTAQILGDAGTWALLATCDGRHAGHVAFVPARERRRDDAGGAWMTRRRIPGVAHLWHLFVRPPWWGRGVAPVLHDAAIESMRARGFVRARLFTPSLHGRARRFYEQRGWNAVDEGWHDGLALMLTEYALPLA